MRANCDTDICSNKKTNSEGLQRDSVHIFCTVESLANASSKKEFSPNFIRLFSRDIIGKERRRFGFGLASIRVGRKQEAGNKNESDRPK